MSIFNNSCPNLLAFPIGNEDELLLKFREKLLGIKNLSCPLDQVYLLRLLRYSKYNLDKAVKTEVNWWTERHKRPWLYQGLHPILYKKIYSKTERSCLVVIKQRDPEGRQIVMYKPGNWNPKESTFIDEFKANFSILDTITERQLTQLHGVIYIVDLENISLQHVREISPTCIKDMIYCMEGFPMKIANIHFVNNPFIFNSLWSVAKFMIKAKIKERIYFHGYNHQNLHKFIGPELLPNTLGGFSSPEDAEEPEFTNLILEKDLYYREMFDGRYGIKLE